MNIKIFYTFLGLTFITAIYGCGNGESKAEKQKEKPLTIATFALKKEKLSTQLSLPGELIALQQVDLYAKVSSFVKSLKVDIGSEVSKGQLLMTLEAPEMASQLAASQSRIKAQEAIYTASKANYNRLYETSKTPGTISTNDLDQALARKNSDLAQLEAAKAAYKEVGSVQDYLTIRAPFSGIISARNVNLGAYVGPSGKGSDLPLFTLQDQKNLRLAVSIPEVYTGYLKAGDEVSFTVKSIPNKTFTARVKRLSGALDLRLRSERIEMDVPNASKTLLPGMVAEVNIPLPANAGTFVVAKKALLDTSEGLFVLKVVDGKAVKVAVKKGRETDNQVELFGSLEEGDKLVAEPTEEMHEGMPIKS
ncbi:RND family efflux transporter MFP subunit [Pedobacter psychrotolerans]|uniref:RND family efflux transporter MFP subunit n=1 Tax=Pedobacter psychrotolerans TaxID=1843235 RepID=A0A4R2HQY1_9SPHI|nr:efflux RND transporter periplasmic adaptor subunit [Pedobacter psychrotolerans]TCO31341.1 RND family efflux transporter MFP subunit [Pedobacter psychrotolerans]GGE40456.1 secretion protein HlyD [Pedobacter psychrotolerans]